MVQKYCNCSLPTALMACLAISALAQAAPIFALTSIPTTSVKGRVPLAAPSITGAVGVGETLTGVSGFSDVDGDSESGTTYTWSGAGITDATASAKTLEVPAAAGANTITLTVTPRTDPTVTDPAVGVMKAVALDIPASLGAFLTPDTVLRDWSEANIYCQQLGGRLPDITELQNLYLSATSATVSGSYIDEMCSTHGWPIGGDCGSSTSIYWSRTGSAVLHSGMDMTYGEDYPLSDAFNNLVSCVR